MKTRRAQKIANEILSFEIINRRQEGLNRFKKGDIVVPVGSHNIMDYGIVDNVDENISKVMVDYDGNIKQCDPDDIRVFVFAKSLKQARRVKKSI